jgi:hypothetical protein
MIEEGRHARPKPGTTGAAFRDAGSALRREGQSFRQIAEAIERTGRPAPGYENPVQQREPLQQMASEPGEPAWRRALALVRKIVLFPLRRRIMSLAITLIAILLLYALHGFVAIGEQFSGYFDGAGAVLTSADKAISSLSSFVNERILPQSKEATAPPMPPVPIPSPPAAAPSPSPARLRGPDTRKDAPQFRHGGAVHPWRRRLLLGRWSILTFCRVTHAYSLPAEAIVGGLMYSLTREQQDYCGPRCEVGERECRYRRIEQKPSAIKATDKS